jgi:hypothetical protein
MKLKKCCISLKIYYLQVPHKDYFTFFIECVSFFKGAGKTPKDNDWFAQGNALQQTQNLDNFGGRLNASVVVHCRKCVLFLDCHLYQ